MAQNAILKRFESKSRQRARAALRRICQESVNQANPTMGRRERRKLARAYAVGTWRSERAEVR